jgi:hypothetical protein
MMSAVAVRPSAQAGHVELQVGGAVALLGPAEAREVAARLLVASDAIESVEVPPLAEALRGGG